MKYKILYFDEVRSDVREAKEWYKIQSPGLEKRFAAEIKTAILHLKINPGVFAIRYRDIRITHPQNFPYAIHY